MSKPQKDNTAASGEANSEIKISPEVSKFDLALFQLKKKLSRLPITKDSKNDYHKSSYASLPHIQKTIYPEIEDAGFMIKFRPWFITKERNPAEIEIGDRSVAGLTLVVLHLESGEADSIDIEQYDIADNIQKVGSFQTYGRRYLLILYFDLNIDDGEGDGNVAAGYNKQPKQAPSKPKNVMPVTHGNPALLKHKDYINVKGELFQYIESTYKTGKNVGKPYTAIITNPLGAKEDSNYLFYYSNDYKTIIANWVNQYGGDEYVDPDDVKVN